MTEGKKKENIENVKKRMAKFRSKPGFDRLEIAGILPELKQDFLNLPGNNYAEKLNNVMEAWKQYNSLISARQANKPVTGKIIPQPETIKTIAKPLQITDWLKFEKDFNNFLYDFKISNQTRLKLRTQGKQIREALEGKQEYGQAFKKICDKLPENILKHFKPMYRQGYFYLYERDITEIAEANTRDEVLLLLYESLRHMGREEPVKEAKKILGLSP